LTGGTTCEELAHESRPLRSGGPWIAGIAVVVFVGLIILALATKCPYTRLTILKGGIILAKPRSNEVFSWRDIQGVITDDGACNISFRNGGRVYLSPPDLPAMEIAEVARAIQQHLQETHIEHWAAAAPTAHVEKAKQVEHRNTVDSEERDTADDEHASGNLLAQFHARNQHTLPRVAVSFLLLAIGIGCFVALLQEDRLRPKMHVQIGIFAAASCAIGLLVLAGGRRPPSLNVLARSDGITLVEDGITMKCRWNEVRTVREKRGPPIAPKGFIGLYAAISAYMQGTTRLLEIQTFDGKVLRFTNWIADFAGLRGLVERETLRHMLPPSLEAISRLQPVSFEMLDVRREGLVYGGQTLTWDRLQVAKIQPGLVSIYSAGSTFPCFSVGGDSLPNLHLFQELIKHFGGKTAVIESDTLETIADVTAAFAVFPLGIMFVWRYPLVFQIAAPLAVLEAFVGWIIGTYARAASPPRENAPMRVPYSLWFAIIVATVAISYFFFGNLWFG
jgi:hypothetical protein